MTIVTTPTTTTTSDFYQIEAARKTFQFFTNRKISQRILMKYSCIMPATLVLSIVFFLLGWKSETFLDVHYFTERWGPTLEESPRVMFFGWYGSATAIAVYLFIAIDMIAASLLVDSTFKDCEGEKEKDEEEIKKFKCNHDKVTLMINILCLVFYSLGAFMPALFSLIIILNW